MATQYTSLLGLALPVQGELSGTWGDTVNNAITSLLDTAVAGTTSITTDADTTLTTTTGASNQARQAIILWNPASGTTTRNITAPAQSKIYTVINASGGTQSIVFRGVGPTTGVTIVKGESAVVAWNGTDFIKVSNTGGSASFTNVTVTGTTTLSGLTASTALALDASKNVVSVTNTGTGNNVLSASPTLTGTITAAAANFSGAVALGDAAADNITVNGTVTSNLIFTDNTYDIGASGATRPRNLFLAGNATVGGNIVLTGSLDLTNLEVTNIKAKDGTAGMQIADSTGVVSFTANPVMSGGTANGVAYLNGSKVLTTGSALTFDGTNLGLNATPTSYGANYRTFALNAVSGSQIDFQVGGTVKNYIYGSSATFQYDSTSNHAWSLSGSEQMRLTSTGLGIGTSSPTAKLDVFGLSQLNTGTYAAGYALSFAANSETSRKYQMGMVTGGNFAIYDSAAAATRLTLDSSGNLGLGVTPSAWVTAAGRKAIEVGALGNALFGAGASDFSMFSNAYINTSAQTTYANNGAAARYQHADGSHRWFNAPSGTAGNAISFTQAMTLDASGNLMLGVTSAVGKLTVNAGDVSGYSRGFDVNFNLGASSFHAVTASSDFNGLLIASNANDATPVNTALPSWGVDIGGRNATSAGADSFSVARLPAGSSTWASFLKVDSSGNLLVGKTAADITTVGFEARGNGDAKFTRSGSTSATTTLEVYSTGASAYRFYVDMAGTVYATSTTISAISDQRLKENVRDIDTGLDAIMALKPRRFDWKEGKGQDKKNAAGFIAQEFETVFPECVGTSKAGGDGVEYKNINHETLIPTLVKAIQELKAEFDAYKASHP